MGKSKGGGKTETQGREVSKSVADTRHIARSQSTPKNNDFAGSIKLPKSQTEKLPAEATRMESKELKLPGVHDKGIGTVDTWDQKRDRKAGA